MTLTDQLNLTGYNASFTALAFSKFIISYKDKDAPSKNGKVLRIYGYNKFTKFHV